jgi:hypothetical protein
MYFIRAIIRITIIPSVTSCSMVDKYQHFAGHVARVGKRSGSQTTSVGRPEAEKSLRRTMHKWKDNIKMDIKKMV